MRSRAVYVVLTFVAVLRAAHAETAEDAYLEGRRLYDLQEWDGAIEKFKLAYKLRADAASLFNIAQAYRLKGDCAQAVRFYKTYKRNFPNAKNLAKVDKWIAQLEACASSSKPIDKPADTKPKGADDQAMASSSEGKPTEPKLPEAKPTDTKPTDTKPTDTKPTDTKPGSATLTPPADPKPAEVSPTVTTPPAPAATEPQLDAPPAPAESSAGPRVLTWVAFGLAGVALGSGAVFGYRAQTRFDEYSTTMDQARYFELRDEVQSNARIANIGFIAAGSFAVVGAVMFFVEGRRSNSVSVAIDPVSSGVYAWGHF